MNREYREARYDPDLGLEAYQLQGVVQSFPTHFHEHYVIGCLAAGARRMTCRAGVFDLGPGDLVLLNPRDSHGCAPIDSIPLDYQAVNISQEVMERLCRDLTGRPGLPHFRRSAVSGGDAAPALRALYGAVASGAPRLEKEEAVCFLLEQLLRDHCGASLPESGTPALPIQALCGYMEVHYTENLSLDQLASMTPFGKSYMLRAFTRQVGVSPYRYLQTVRLNRARAFLEQGYPAAEAAVMAGFADQSHFTRFFKEFTGLTPGQYQRIFPTEKGSRNHGLHQ